MDWPPIEAPSMPTPAREPAAPPATGKRSGGLTRQKGQPPIFSRPTLTCRGAPMLPREENDVLTQTGPGTPMGAMLRRYWLPPLLSEDLPEPDGAPRRVQLLG